MEEKLYETCRTLDEILLENSKTFEENSITLDGAVISNVSTTIDGTESNIQTQLAKNYTLRRQINKCGGHIKYT